MTLAERIAEDIWNRLEYAKTLGVRLGEETLTDLLVLDLKSHEHNNNVRVFHPNRHQESFYGSDWEIVIRDTSGKIRKYVVQAKKITFRDNTGKGVYENLGKFVKSRGKCQLELLENRASAIGATPCYAFYNTGVGGKDYWHCCKPYDPNDQRQFGCTLVSSNIVKLAISYRGRYSRRCFEKLHRSEKSLPFRCLVDCPKRDGNYQSFETGQVEKLWPEEWPEELFNSDMDSDARNPMVERYLRDRDLIHRPRRLLFVDKINIEQREGIDN